MIPLIDRLRTALEGRYRIERELGEGGMATVYLADDLKHGRKVALKVLKPELAAVVGAERFLAEIRTTANLQHPHILPLFDSGEADGHLFFVMPYIEGETLADRIDRERQLPVDEAVRIATAVAGALQAAHDRGVIHRDIKPANILLSGGQPLVADFGIALAVGAGGARLTETGLSVGTPYYMSPEQATGDQAIGPAADIYALACVLYEMLVGEPPYLGNTAQAVLGKIIQGLPVSATAARKTVPAHVDAAIRRALEKLPADRFTRAADFGAALSDPTFRHGAESQPPGAEGTGPWKRISVATTSLAAIFAIALGWALLRPDVAGPVVRYRVALPGGQAGGDGFALAPDGSWLTYVGPGSSPGETQLWVKARDQLDATPLAGTTGARGMAVSPDGNWIAFAASGQLRRIPAGGGVATTIADGVSRFPPIWLDDGMLAYSDPQSRLQRVPSAGGISEVVFTAPAGRFAIPVTALPDGRGFLFLNCRATCSSSGDLWVADGGSGETRLLLPDAGWAAYADGRLLFAGREDGVFGVPFDLATLGVEGAPVPLFDAAIMPQRITLSASGTMAYMPWEGRDGLSAAVWVSRDGDAVPMDTTWGFQTDINLAGWSLSPDHMRLAITLGGQSSPQDVWIKELDGGPVSRLTFNDSTDIRPRWTPDGRGLMFISNRAGDYDLYRRRSDGTGADSLLLDLETPIFEALWSPDGEWLVLRVGGGSIASRDIMALQVERDTVPRPLLTAPHDEEQPALSPDGRWMAYVSTETGRQEVFVRPFPEVEAGKWQVSTAGGTSPVWAHSGQELFFVNGDREVMSQAVLPGAAFQRGGLRMLFSMAGYEVAPNYASFDISPDDRRFLVVRRKDESGPDEVLVVVENWLAEVERMIESGSR